MNWKQSTFRIGWQKRLIVLSGLLIMMITIVNLLLSSQMWFSESFSGIVEQVQQTLDLAPESWHVS